MSYQQNQQATGFNDIKKKLLFWAKVGKNIMLTTSPPKSISDKVKLTVFKNGQLFQIKLEDDTIITANYREHIWTLKIPHIKTVYKILSVRK